MLQEPLTVLGPQVEERILKPTPSTLPAVVLETVSFHGRPVICGTLHRVLLPLTGAVLLSLCGGGLGLRLLKGKALFRQFSQ